MPAPPDSVYEPKTQEIGPTRTVTLSADWDNAASNLPTLSGIGPGDLTPQGKIRAGNRLRFTRVRRARFHKDTARYLGVYGRCLVWKVLYSSELCSTTTWLKSPTPVLVSVKCEREWAVWKFIARCGDEDPVTIPGREPIEGEYSEATDLKAGPPPGDRPLWLPPEIVVTDKPTTSAVIDLLGRRQVRSLVTQLKPPYAVDGCFVTVTYVVRIRVEVYDRDDKLVETFYEDPSGSVSAGTWVLRIPGCTDGTIAPGPWQPPTEYARSGQSTSQTIGGEAYVVTRLEVWTLIPPVTERDCVAIARYRRSLRERRRRVSDGRVTEADTPIDPPDLREHRFTIPGCEKRTTLFESASPSALRTSAQSVRVDIELRIADAEYADLPALDDAITQARLRIAERIAEGPARFDPGEGPPPPPRRPKRRR